MKLFDFECSRVGCDNRFEVFTDSDDQQELCPVCQAPAVKLLGGRPSTHSGGEHDHQHYESPDFDRAKVDERQFETKLRPIMDLGCAGETEKGEHVHMVLADRYLVPKNKA